MPAAAPLSALLSPVLIAFTIELDNEYERRFAEAGIGRRFGVSLVMWSNFMRFVGDGIGAGELPAVAGLPKARLLSTLGGLERWRYVTVGPRSGQKRDGYGSARGLRADWVVRPTQAGRVAVQIWRPLPVEIERRWEDRFGSAAGELKDSLRAIVAGLDVSLPEYLPIVGSPNGMIAEVDPRGPKIAAADHLSALLSQVLLAYTLDFEQRSELSLPLSANVIRVLDENGTALKDLPLAAGVSKEAVAMAMTFLTKNGYVAVESKVARLTPKGRDAGERSARLHEEVERTWEERFGKAAVRRLRRSLAGLVGSRLSEGLEPNADGWRATKRYREQTIAVLADPVAALPQYPMVLHRGGWPDGS